MERLTAAEELRRFRMWLIAANTARAAGNTVDEAKARQMAEQYKQMYLSRGDGDLNAIDRIVLSVGNTVSAIGSFSLDRIVMPLALVAAAAYFYGKGR